MQNMRAPVILPLAVAALTAPTRSLATNGYFEHGYGTQSKGMAGAGAALALDGISVATDPASLAFLGDRLDVGLALFNPNRDYEVTGAPSGHPGTFGLAPGKV
jgi:long-chain fatty acid transport protein